MRQVIEAGTAFTPNHFFILLLQLDAKEVTETLSDFIACLIRTLKIPEDEFDRFLSGLRDVDLTYAYTDVKSVFY